MSETKIMRDVFLETLYLRMQEREDIFFLSADFGSPVLDKIRADFKDRFINVGIAEQNLINVATGLALEGYAVYVYAIAPFLTMRAFEQIRNNLALQAQLREVNVNIVGVGAGLSYDVSGPTHHCLEDISILNTLPNITIFSPSDCVQVERFVDYSLDVKSPKYLRLDGKSIVSLYDKAKFSRAELDKGYQELKSGSDLVIVSTGYMTHTALKIAEMLSANSINIGVIDVFLVKPCDKVALANSLEKYQNIVTLEEAFINKGGLDSVINQVINSFDLKFSKVIPMGFPDTYVYEIGGREYLHKQSGLDSQSLCNLVGKLLTK